MNKQMIKGLVIWKEFRGYFLQPLISKVKNLTSGEKWLNQGHRIQASW